jgi:anti-anti-sigma factor
MEASEREAAAHRQASGREAKMMVQNMAGRAWVVRCAQPLDAQASAGLRALVTGSVQRARRMILDLSAAAYADSVGLRELLALQQRLRLQGTELRLVVPPGSRIDRALRLVGFASLLALYPTARLAWRASRVPVSSSTDPKSRGRRRRAAAQRRAPA